MKMNPSQLKNLQLEQEHKQVILSEYNILAVDYGTRYTGLAFMDKAGGMLPLGVYKTLEIDEKIRDVLEKKQVKILVFGLPLGQDGKENPLCQRIRSMAKKYISLVKEVHFVNEKYSSALALGQTNDRVDDLAALRILEFYLDQKKLP